MKMLFIVAIMPLQCLVRVLLYLLVVLCAASELREAGRRRLQPLLCAAVLWALLPPSLWRRAHCRMQAVLPGVTCNLFLFFVTPFFDVWQASYRRVNSLCALQ